MVPALSGEQQKRSWSQLMELKLWVASTLQTQKLFMKMNEDDHHTGLYGHDHGIIVPSGTCVFRVDIVLAITSCSAC